MNKETDTGSTRSVTRAFVLVPWLKSAEQDAKKRGRLQRTQEARLEEAVGLAVAIRLSIVGTAIANVAEPRPATLIGEGKVEELKGLFEELKTDLVIVDGHLSPVQQRNLEKAWNLKILDRTGLILWRVDDAFCADAVSRGIVRSCRVEQDGARRPGEPGVAVVRFRAQPAIEVLRRLGLQIRPFGPGCHPRQPSTCTHEPR